MAAAVALAAAGVPGPAAADPLTEAQWGLRQVRAAEAWAVTRGAGAVVAVVDSGVDAGHPDLAGRVTAGFDFVTGTPTSPTTASDQNGHGTHVAAIAVAADNGVGIVGVAPEARVMPLRVLDARLVGPAGAVAAAVDFAVERGVQVVNLSLGRSGGPPGSNPALLAAVNRANAAGVVVVASAGNDRTGAGPPPGCGDPASAPGVVCVTAVDDHEQLAPYANFPSKADRIGLAAPGGSGGPACGQNVLSAVRRGTSADVSRCGTGPDHAEDVGTSQATAFVSGVAALLRARGLDRAATIAALTGTARQPVTGRRGEHSAAYGWGIVDAAAALGLASPAGRSGAGYHLVASDGGVFSFGAARFLGSTGGIGLNRPVVAAAAHADGGGYWLVASDGGVFAFGNARFLGSTGGVALASPVVAMAATPDGGGYWLAAADGGVFAFGTARFLGSAAGTGLPAPVVAMAATPGGDGYWLAAADGSVRAFGSARFLGSRAGRALNRPVVAMASAPDGAGYWLVASDGGVFAFGSAGFHGSTGALRLNRPVVAVAAEPDGAGYWLVASDGGVFAFGSAAFHGSTGALRLNRPVVGALVT